MPPSNGLDQGHCCLEKLSTRMTVYDAPSRCASAHQQEQTQLSVVRLLSSPAEYIMRRHSCHFASPQFNKSVCEEAIELFPKNVTCKTIHGISGAGSSINYRREGKLKCTVEDLQSAITTMGCDNVSPSVSVHEAQRRSSSAFFLCISFGGCS